MKQLQTNPFLLLLCGLMFNSILAQTIVNPRTPDGFENPQSKRIVLNQSSSTFDVPKGKNLYIVQMNVTPSSVMTDNTTLKVDGKSVYDFNHGTNRCSPKGLNKYLSTPIIIGQGSKLNLEGKGTLMLETFTVDAKVKVKIITNDESLKIPKGQTFVLLHTVRTSSCSIAYEGNYTFSEIDDLHFPEFFQNASDINDKLSDFQTMFGYFY